MVVWNVLVKVTNVVAVTTQKFVGHKFSNKKFGLVFRSDFIVQQLGEENKVLFGSGFMR